MNLQKYRTLMSRHHPVPAFWLVGILLGVAIVLTLADVATFGAPRHPMTALLLVLVSALVAFNARRAPHGAS